MNETVPKKLLTDYQVLVRQAIVHVQHTDYGTACDVLKRLEYSIGQDLRSDLVHEKAAGSGKKKEAEAKALFRKVEMIVREKLAVESNTEITEGTTLIEDLTTDSLDWVELIMAIEDTFDIEIPDDDAEKIKTVGDIVSLLIARQVTA